MFRRLCIVLLSQSFGVSLDFGCSFLHLLCLRIFSIWFCCLAIFNTWRWMFWMFTFGCSDVRMFGCSDVRMFGCSDVRCSDVLGVGCSGVGCWVLRVFGCWMFGCSDVLCVHYYQDVYFHPYQY